MNDAVQRGLQAFLAGRQAAQSRLEQQMQQMQLEEQRMRVENMQKLFPVQFRNAQLAGITDLARIYQRTGGDLTIPPDVAGNAPADHTGMPGMPGIAGASTSGQAIHFPTPAERDAALAPSVEQLGKLSPEENALYQAAKAEDALTGNVDARRQVLGQIMTQRSIVSRQRPVGDMVPDPDPESLTGVKKVYYGLNGEVVREVKNLLVPGMQPKVTSGTRTVTDEFGNTTVQRTAGVTQTIMPGAAPIKPSPAPRKTAQAPAPTSAPQPDHPGGAITPNPKLDPFVDALSGGKMTLQQVPQSARAAVITRAKERNVELPGIPGTKSGSQAGLTATQISINNLNAALDKADWSWSQRELLATALTIQGDNIVTANIRGPALAHLTPENLQVENWVRGIREDAASLRQYLGNPPVRSDRQFAVILAVVPSASDILAGKEVAKTRLTNFAKVVNGIKAALKPGARPEDGLIDPSKVPPDIRKQAGIAVSPQEEADWYLAHPK